MAVYFIRATESDRIKIGFTDRPIPKRLGCLQTAAPEPLELLHVCPSGTREDEHTIHKRFKRFRVHGEWFVNSLEITVLIRVLQKNTEKERFFIHAHPCNPIETKEFSLLRKEGHKMPARVVDGNSLWRSKKLKKVAQMYRAEYANLLPLAEANGVFDADAERVWSDVYAFNRPDITPEMVEEILEEFEEADLLRRWRERDKLWGFWVGINKSGRLPSETHIKRYKNLPPNPPPNLSGIIRDDTRNMPEGFGIGMDRNGIGMVREEAEPETLKHDFPENGQEEEMKAEKQIPISCQQILDVRAETYPDVLNQIKALALRTSNGQVLREFEEWAMENQGDDFRGKPLSAWLRSLDGVRSEAKQAASDSVVTHLVRELVYRSDSLVSFDNKQKLELRRILDEGFESDEIIAVFRVFFQNLDASRPDEVRYAAKNFVEKAADMAFVARRKAAEKQAEQAAVAAATERMTREAEEERRVRLEAAEREKELIEEDLPD